MSKKRDRKKRRAQREIQRLTGKTKIEDYYSVGPLEMFRAGKHVVMRNTATPEQQEEILKHAREVNEQLFVELGEKAEALREKVGKYSALDLMHRAGYEALNVLKDGMTESEMTSGQVQVLPALEYLQYLIHRTPENSEAEEISDDGWKELWGEVKEVIDTTSRWLMTRAPKNVHDKEIESLAHSLDLMRLTVRVDRFPNFLEDYWRTSLLPYDQLLKDTYGVGTEEIVGGLMQLQEHQKRGVIQKYEAMMSATAKAAEKARSLGLNIDSPTEADLKQYKDALKDNEELRTLHNDAEAKARTALTVEVFEITDVTTLPKEILSMLSIKPGEDPLALFTGPNREDLSPLSTDVGHYKPFVESDGKYYAFYHSGFEDRIAEIIEDDMNKRYPAKRSALEKARSDYIEEDSVKLISNVVVPDYAATNMYYPNPDDPGHQTELDGLIEVDDVLFLIEVKAGGISAGTSRGAPKSLESDLKDLISEGQRQSERAERYINSADEVEFFDETGKKILHKVRHDKFRKVIRVVVTREQLGWVGASLGQLAGIDPSITQSLPWHVSLDDLRAISELFEGKGLEFAHYLEVRLEAGKAQSLSQHDEVDHVALYHAHNYYHKNVEPDATRMTFNAYGLEIDKYFMAKQSGETLPVPVQKMPIEFTSMLNALDESKQAHRFEVASFLLSNNGKDRKDIAKQLRKVYAISSGDKQRAVRLVAKELGMGMSISSPNSGNWEAEEKRCALFMKQHNLNRWLSVQVDGTNGLDIKDIKELKSSDYDEADFEAAKLKLEKDILLNASRQKITANQKCPCGSGERYKDCHGQKK